MSVPFLAQAKAFRRKIISWWADNKSASHVALLPWDTVFAGGRTAKQVESLYLPPNRRILSSGKRLNDKRLSDIFHDEELGDWSLNADTLNFFQEKIKSDHPQVILEFGAGISTICWALWMKDLHGATPGQFRVFSVEQNEWQAEKTRELLRQLGLGSLASVLHAPLERQRFDQIETECYRLPQNELAAWFEGASPDFIVIDGPFGDEWSRYGVLPIIQPHVKPGAVFYLDDSFRVQELLVAAQWRKLAFIHCEGIYRVGKGVLAGHFHNESPQF